MAQLTALRGKEAQLSSHTPVPRSRALGDPAPAVARPHPLPDGWQVAMRVLTWAALALHSELALGLS